jgi:3-dehydroquinate synthase
VTSENGEGGATHQPDRAGATVRVALGARSYDVVLGDGLMASAGADIARRFAGRAAIVTDQNVARTHLGPLEASLSALGRHRGSVVLPAGEQTKSFDQLARLASRLLELGVERGDLVVALGGGVIGDLAGFAAAILRRGVKLVQIPTSLLAQVDSSVGGKTGINTAEGKNLVGAFHQPSLVLADIGALRTLPDREMRAGYAEVVKYGLLGDRDHYHWLETAAAAILAHQPEAALRAVEASVRMKAEIVARDETETGDRMLLNLGHTFGHALEAFTGYSSRLLHGEAVAIGMTLAFRLSERLGLCPPQTAARVAAHLKSVGLPTAIVDIPGERPSPATVVALMGQDKKVRNGQLTLILTRDIGAAFVSREVGAGEVERFLATDVA